MERKEIERAIDLQRKRIAFEDDVYPKNIDEFILAVLVAELSRQENAPLTAKELEEMIDKPIFIVYKSQLGANIVRKWAIPYMVYEGTAHCTDGENWYPAPNCQIYRYEPKREKE